MNGFVGEFLILLGAFRWQPAARPSFAATGVILSAVYMLWMFQRVNYGAVTNEKNRTLPDLTPREWALMVPTIAHGHRDGRRARASSCARWSRRSPRVIERVNGSQPARVSSQPAPVPSGRPPSRARRSRDADRHADAAPPRADQPTLGRPSIAAARTPKTMSDYVAIIPILIVVLAGDRRDARRGVPAAGRADAASAGLGLIGLVGAARVVGHAVGQRRAAASASSAPTTSRCSSTSILCVVGILTMLFSDEVVEREGLPAGRVLRADAVRASAA